MIYNIIIIFFTLIMSAFFSGIEMAFVSCDKLHIELEKKKNSLSYKLLNIIINKPREFISAMLIGNNISLVIYGICMGNLIKHFLYFKIYNLYSNSILDLFFQTFFSTFIVLILAEFLPKLIFRIYANELLFFFIIPVYFIYLLFYPLTKFIIFISNKFFIFFLNYKYKNINNNIFDKEDLGNLLSERIKHQNNKINNIDYEVEILYNALDFSEIKARECMIPRKEIIAIDFSSISINTLSKKFTDKGLSKIIVYKNNIDNIVGYIHYIELFKKPKNLDLIISPVEFVYETISAKDIMNLLIKKKIGIAVVLDEYGGTSGLITIEDVLEELLGNIEDEHDKVKYVEKKINDNEFIFSARLEIDYLNNKYKFNLPKSEDYETLGGFIVSRIENIPKEGESMIFNNYFFIFNKVSKNKIEEIFLKI